VLAVERGNIGGKRRVEARKKYLEYAKESLDMADGKYEPKKRKKRKVRTRRREGIKGERIY